MHSFRKRMIPVFIVPTGLGCEIGGHAGDATPAAKLIASVSDILITHPNVVNASDINEMTENMLYVEGSVLDRFLEHKINLEPVNYNRILLAVNSPVDINTINAVSAARANIGADISITELDTPLLMTATKNTDGSASGTISGIDELVEQVSEHDYDALAIATEIKVEGGLEVVYDYLHNSGVNPWGGVEAIVSRRIADKINKPVAHAPITFADHPLENFKEIVDPRMAAECVSVCYLHCVLKGLHKAPRIGVNGLSANEVSCLISPVGCYGRPHRACDDSEIPIIVVNDNKVATIDESVFIPQPNIIYVENYLEAAGIVASMKAGIDPRTVKRPLLNTDSPLKI